MSQPIGPINPIKPLLPIEQSGGNTPMSEGNHSFSTMLKDAINNLDQSQLESEQAAAVLATGETDDFHTPVIAMEKASLALGLAVTVRNKVLDAYHEIMRMQI